MGGGADRTGLCDALQKKKMHESCRMVRRIVVMELIYSLGLSEDKPQMAT